MSRQFFCNICFKEVLSAFTCIVLEVLTEFLLILVLLIFDSIGDWINFDGRVQGNKSYENRYPV